MEQKESPYTCHVFVCTNDRHGEKRSCADGNSPAILDAVKKEISNRGWKKEVRVSKSGCFGLCGKGPNIIIYPQKTWFSEVSIDDVAQIVQKVEDILGKNS